MSINQRIAKILTLLFLFILVFGPTVAWGISWKKIKSGKFHVYYEKKSEGQDVLEIAKESYPDISSELSFEPPGKIKIYVFHDRPSFLKTSPSEQAGGYTYPFKNEIFVLATRESLRTTLRHEISHIVFIRSVPDASQIPFWFIEGLAYYQSRPGASVLNTESVVTKKDLPSIAELSNERPSTEDDESKVAAEGYLAIKYIVDTYGEMRLHKLVRQLQDGEDFSQSVERSLGVTEKELEYGWRNYVEKERNQVWLIHLRYIGLLIIGALAILASVVGLWRYRKRFEGFEDEEIDSDYEEGMKD